MRILKSQPSDLKNHYPEYLVRFSPLPQSILLVLHVIVIGAPQYYQNQEKVMAQMSLALVVQL